MKSMKRFLTVVLLLLSISCATGPCVIYSEGADARDAMSHTVAIVHTYKLMVPKNIDKGVDFVEKIGIEYGSGVVVRNYVDATEADRSLIVTAKHVAMHRGIGDVVEIGDGVGVVLDVKREIVRLDGKKCDVRTVFLSPDADVAVLESSCAAGSPAQIAETLPPVGASVLTSGIPNGQIDMGSFSVVDGRYISPCEIDLHGKQVAFLCTTVPTVAGMSGSGIFHRGKLFSILVRVSTAYEHTTLSIKLDEMTTAIDKAQRIVGQ